jgi:hypothetical protein
LHHWSERGGESGEREKNKAAFPNGTIGWLSPRAEKGSDRGGAVLEKVVGLGIETGQG